MVPGREQIIRPQLPLDGAERARTMDDDAIGDEVVGILDFDVPDLAHAHLVDREHPSKSECGP